MKLLSTTCKKATYLLSKKEEGKLSWLERIQLRSHLTICSACRKFEEQTKLIIRGIKNIQSNAVLSPEAKIKIRELLKP